jgi:hypothetical protein
MSLIDQQPTNDRWTFKATVPAILYSTKLPLPPRSTADRAERIPGSRRLSVSRRREPDTQRLLAGRDYSEVDAGEFGSGNCELWRGLKGVVPYSEIRTGEDFRQHRHALLRRYGRSDGTASVAGAR